MKRLLLFTEADSFGGAQKVMGMILKYIDTKKFLPEVLVARGGDYIREICKNKDIPYNVLSMPPLKKIVFNWGIKVINPWAVLVNFFCGVKYILKLSSFLKERAFDVIHTHSLVGDLFVSLAWFLSGRKGKLIWHTHNIQPKGFRRFMYGVFAQWFPDKIVAVSKAVQNSLPPSVKEKVVVIPNCIEEEENICDVDVREKYGVKDKLLVVTVGSIYPLKGQDIFIKASLEVLKKIRNVSFFVVGGTPQGRSKEYEDKLREMVRGFESNFVFTGYVENASPYIKEADVVVIPSRMESFGLVALEAMREEKPVVCSNVGGLTEIVEDGVNGYKVDVGDYVSMANKMLRLLKDSATRKEMGRMGRAKFQKMCNVERFIEDVCSIY